jgi:molecular chaperone GrpE (heat shock protein)
MKKVEDYRKKAIKHAKKYILRLRKVLDAIEKDLDSNDAYKNMKGCYYGIAMVKCLKNIHDEVYKLLEKNELSMLKDKYYGYKKRQPGRKG